MKKIKSIFLIVMTLISTAVIYLASPAFLPNKDSQAIGDLNVIWGVPDGDPIFVVTNSAPGDMQTRPVVVQNNSSSVRPVGVRGIEQGGDTIKNVLEITIYNGSGDLYGGTTGTKTVNQFFLDSAGINGIFLVNIAPNTSKTFNFKIVFPQSAGNVYQAKSTIFDIVIGISIEVPQECQNIQFEGNPIIGTSLGDAIEGGPGNDLILGLEGGDAINGNGGNDCIIGGPGGDAIRGNNGNDVIFGNEDSDSLMGNNGEDLLVGGVGHDDLKGGNENDQLFGNEGHDSLDGENGNDTLDGAGGDDSMRGGAGNDSLTGGPGQDFANGQNGNDFCEAEFERFCEL